MSDDLSNVIDDAYPACPRCGARLEDAGTDVESVRLRCATCGLDATTTNHSSREARWHERLNYPVNSSTWKERSSEPVGPAAVAAQAAAFLRAGDLSYEHPGDDSSAPMVLPAIVNWCLSIELFLKALVLNAGQKPGRTHDLGRLLRLVPAEDRSSIEVRWRELVALASLSELLEEIADYFQAVRYDYEWEERSYQEMVIRRALSAIAEVSQSKAWRPGPLPTDR